jgi:hypothetical protein
MTTPNATCDQKKLYAAQNAREGLITVADLGILTGVDVRVLTKFAKVGLLNHYGEYHGKRFFKFEEIVNWAGEPADGNPARDTIRCALETELKTDDCPYELETVRSASGDVRIGIVWKEVPAAQAAA